MKHRVAAWKRYYNFTGKLGVYFFLARVAITLHNPELVQLVTRVKEKLPSNPVLIVVDTKARNYAGNENATEDENAFVAGCDYLREALAPATVLSVHHTGWIEQDRARGSSASYAALDTEIQCLRDGDRLTLKCTKQKDSEYFQELAFEAIPMHKSLVLKAMDQTGGKLDGNRLACLRAVHRLEGGATYKEWKREAGLEKKNSSFAAARDWLVAQSYVKLGAEKKYLITDAGLLAVSPLSIVSPSSVHRSQVSASPSRGGMVIPHDGPTHFSDHYEDGGDAA